MKGLQEILKSLELEKRPRVGNLSNNPSHVASIGSMHQGYKAIREEDTAK